jgi:hypothetical protein
MMRFLFAGIVLICCAVSSAVAATTAKEAITSYFTDGDRTPSVNLKGKVLSVEVCLDLCDFYRANTVDRETDLWDLIFLHQYYWNEDSLLDTFRTRYGPVAVQVLALHAKDCAVQTDKDKSKCAIERLQKKLGANYWLGSC